MNGKDTQHTLDHIPGMIQKAASLSIQDVTDEELKAINRYTLEPLKAEDVFTFKAVLCDNEVDRQHDQFTQKALQDMQKLYLGKTVIKDHRRSTDGQVARIYATELVQGSKTLKSGEIYTQLVAHCYMVRTASNEDLIAEIKGGIKKEGSVGFAPSGSICSICGTDNVKSYCRHWPGKEYDKEGGKSVCTFKLTGVRDAYEFSLVAVPAQRAAGVSKSYTGETVYEKDEPETTPEPRTASEDKTKELALRARMCKINAKNNTYILKED
jgi:hypothetical protein